MTNSTASFVQKLTHKEVVKFIELLTSIQKKTWKKYSYAPLEELPNHFKISHSNWRIVFFQQEEQTRIQNIGYVKTLSGDFLS